jgi:hypothetical protein
MLGTFEKGFDASRTGDFIEVIPFKCFFSFCPVSSTGSVARQSPCSLALGSDTSSNSSTDTAGFVSS